MLRVHKDPVIGDCQHNCCYQGVPFPVQDPPLTTLSGFHEPATFARVLSGAPQQGMQDFFVQIYNTSRHNTSYNRRMVLTAPKFNSAYASIRRVKVYMHMHMHIALDLFVKQKVKI